jgi:hypothetical protein
MAEIAIALMLPTGAGLLIRSFAKLRDIDPGFKTDRLVTLNVQLPISRYGGNQQARGVLDGTRATDTSDAGRGVGVHYFRAAAGWKHDRSQHGD